MSKNSLPDYKLYLSAICKIGMWNWCQTVGKLTKFFCCRFQKCETSSNCSVQQTGNIHKLRKSSVWYHETRSPGTVQRNFQITYRKMPPDVKSITSWYDKLKNTGSVADVPRTNRPSNIDKMVLCATNGAHVETYWCVFLLPIKLG